jgi:uncharacterized protein (DUF4415 family)
MPDRNLDFSDIPEATASELSQARRVVRPRRETTTQLIAIRIDPGLLASLRRMATRLGKPYQTLVSRDRDLCRSLVHSRARLVMYEVRLP